MLADQDTPHLTKGVLGSLARVLSPRPVTIAQSGEDPELPVDTRSPMRFGLRVLAIGLGGFLLWASLAPIDEGVPSTGMVSIDTKRKAVQHLSGGIIKAAYVREGQVVREGDHLLELDEAVAQANFEAVRMRYYTLRATEARLMAEQAGAEKITFHSDLLKVRDDAHVATLIANQEGLFLTRRLALRAEIEAMEESIAGQKASIAGNEGMLKARRSQFELLAEEIKGLTSLVHEGYVPKNDLLALQRASDETMGAISDVQGNIERSRHALLEMRMRIAQRRHEYRKEVDNELAQVRGEVEGEAERFVALRNDLARTVIRSPATGQVVGLAAQTVGGVIAPGQKVMDIVPSGEQLMLETHVPPNLIDRVSPGLQADVRFSAFAHTPALVVPGKVASISNDLLTDEKTGMSYYLARVSVTGDGMETLGSRRLQPGMPVEVVIITGERSLLTYLLHPLLKRIAFSMKEE